MESAVAVILGLLWLLLAAIPLVALGMAIGAFVQGRRTAERVSLLERRLASATEVAALVQAPSAPPQSNAAPEPALSDPEAPEPEAPEPEPEALAPEAEPEAPEPEAPRPPRPSPKPATTPPPRRPISIEQVATWIAAVLGGFLVLLASLFALAVVAERGWLGPNVRVSMGCVAGLVLWVGGTVARTRSYRLLASALSGAGMGTIYGALFAASGMYHLVGPATAFALMSLVTAVSLATATRHRDRFMAHLGLLGGVLTPVLLSTGNNQAVALFSYLFLLVAGAVAAATRRGWGDLVATATLGTLALFGGWSATWYAPDQAPVALVAAGALSLPFAVAVINRRTHLTVVLASAVACALIPLLATPWLVPVDPYFYDPRSGLQVVRGLGSAPLWATAAVALLPVPLWLAGRRRAVLPWLAVAVTALLMLAYVPGWLSHPDVHRPLVALGALAPLGVGLALGTRKGSLVSALLPLLSGLALTAVLASEDVGGRLVLGSLCVLGGLGVLSALLSRRAWGLATTLFGSALALHAAAVYVTPATSGWVAGPAVMLYAILVTLPLRARRFQEGTAASSVAAMAGPALFWPLYQAWTAGLGDAVVGVLPLALGGVALLGALVLLRVHRATASSGPLALFVGVALLGLSAALPIQLHNQWLTVAWALEGALLAALCGRLRHPLLRWTAFGLGVTVAVRLLVNPAALAYGDTAGFPIFNWTLYTWGIPTLTLLASAVLLRRSPPTGALRPLELTLPAILKVAGIAVGFALVNVQVSHLFQHSGPVELGGHGLLQGMVRSLSWAGYGIVVLLAGLGTKSRAVRLIGFCFVLLATAKVFAVDLWALSGFVRVGSVLGLGMSLLVAAFLFERLVLRREPDPTPDTT